MKRSEFQRLAIRLIVLLPITAIILLGACTNSHPALSNSYLSYGFFKQGCNGCADLTDQSEEISYYCMVSDTGGNAPGGIDPTNCNQGNPPTLTLAQWKQD